MGNSNPVENILMSGKPTISLEKVIQTAIDSALKQVHTCLPAVVIRVDNTTQLIDAQITIQRKLSNKLVNFPLLVNVPIRYWKSSTFSITFPIEIGDHVRILFCEKSIDTWLTEGGIQNPFDVRKFDLSDAFAEPVMYHQKDVIPNFSPTNLEIKTNSGNTRIIVKAAEGVEVITTGPTDIKSSSNNVNIESTGDNVNIKAGGDVDVEAAGDVDVESTGANVNVTASGNINVTASGNAIVEGSSIQLGGAASVGVVRVGDTTGIGPGGGPHIHALPNGSTKVLSE